jgi:hypothetical protein
MEKSRVKGKTPTLKSKYSLGTLRMSKPVSEIYINQVVRYTGKGVIVKQETKHKGNETKQAETKRNETQKKRNETTTKNHQ